MPAHTTGGTSLQRDRAGKAPSNAAVSFAADAAASSPVAPSSKGAAGAEFVCTPNHCCDLKCFNAQQLVRCVELRCRSLNQMPMQGQHLMLSL